MVSRVQARVVQQGLPERRVTARSARPSTLALLGRPLSSAEAHRFLLVGGGHQYVMTLITRIGIRNIIPLGIRLPRRRSCALWAGAYAELRLYGVLGSSRRCRALLPCMQTLQWAPWGKERRDQRTQLKTSCEALTSRDVLSCLPRRYRRRAVACHRLRVVVCDNRAPRPSATHSRSDPDRRRPPLRRKPRSLPARQTARTSWRPRPAV